MNKNEEEKEKQLRMHFEKMDKVHGLFAFFLEEGTEALHQCPVTVSNKRAEFMKKSGKWVCKFCGKDPLQPLSEPCSSASDPTAPKKGDWWGEWQIVPKY